ncbi:hypothetical protein V1498_12975 [Peribacillus sp. SCS-26]|uniref:hypothetical protein n=1 Tax=Paraperibacillus marinus TaxID=3115295 RepID=UPI00390633EB
MTKNRWYIFIFLLSSIFVIAFFNSGKTVSKATKAPVEDRQKSKSKAAELSKNIKDLQNLIDRRLSYTKTGTIMSGSGINNIFYSIYEYYNENKQDYQYGIQIQEKDLTEDQIKIKIDSYSIHKLSAGALPDKAADTFKLNASSPVFIAQSGSTLKDGLYYLFSSKKPLTFADFQLEFIFTDRGAPADGKTYRYIANEKKSLITD